MRLEHWLYTLPLRFRSLFRRRRVEQDLDDELQFHLEQQIAEHIEKGLPPKQARQAALRAMDGLTQRKEECRDTRKLSGIENLYRDFRYSARLLRKSPGFTAVTAVTLALAIGANAVVFGVLNGMVLRPLNVPRAESLYGLEHADEYTMMESYSDYVDIRDRNRSFEGLAAFCLTEVGLDTGAGSVRTFGQAVSANYFDVLGIQPLIGRFLHSYDEHGPNSAPYVVLSYAYWHDHFSDDRGVLGRVVHLNKHPFTVIGIAPAGFHGTLLFAFPDFYVPLVNGEQVQWGSLMGSDLLNDRTNPWVFMTLGHLKAAVTPEQAEADLNSIGAELDKTYPKEHRQTRFRLARPSLYGHYLGNPAKAFLTGLLILAGLILLAACANLGGLFSARAADRSREVALRLALGAGRGRILRALFTESLLISLMGGALGLFGGVVLLRAISSWQPLPTAPMHVPVNPDVKVYAVALALAVASGLLFGIVPVRQVLRTDPYQIVKAGLNVTPGRRIMTRDFLLVGQVAICAVLVTSSMVALRGLQRSMHATLGFDPRGALLIDADLNMAGYSGQAVTAMQKRMVEALEKIPGVESVGITDFVPLLTTYVNLAPVFRDGDSDRKPEKAIAHPAMYRVSPGYLRAAGTALIRGRTLDWHDDQNAPRVAVVNQEFARRVFGSVPNAIGAYYRTQDGTRIQVVGAVADGKYGMLTEDARAAAFLPAVQEPPSGGTNLVVRSRADRRQLATAVRSALRRLDSGMPAEIQTWDEGLSIALFPSRLATVALGILGAMGAMLAVTGVFGMAAYSVSRRLRELGIRLALGARPIEILEASLGRAVKFLALGSVAGVVLGTLATRVLGAIVYQANPRDPLVLSGVIVAMSLLGLLATWIPAQRALSLDPVTLLREE